jgi:hypothetical protein
LTANWLTIFKTATDPSPRPPEKPKYKSPSRRSQKSGKCEVTQVHIDLKPYEASNECSRPVGLKVTIPGDRLMVFHLFVMAITENQTAFR